MHRTSPMEKTDGLGRLLLCDFHDFDASELSELTKQMSTILQPTLFRGVLTKGLLAKRNDISLQQWEELNKSVCVIKGRRAKREPTDVPHDAEEHGRTDRDGDELMGLEEEVDEQPGQIEQVRAHNARLKTNHVSLSPFVHT